MGIKRAHSITEKNDFLNKILISFVLFCFVFYHMILFTRNSDIFCFVLFCCLSYDTFYTRKVYHMAFLFFSFYNIFLFFFFFLFSFFFQEISNDTNDPPYTRPIPC